MTYFSHFYYKKSYLIYYLDQYESFKYILLPTFLPGEQVMPGIQPRKFRIYLVLFILIGVFIAPCLAEENQDFRLGIIGLDTSHVTAFTKFINDPNQNSGCKVIAAYPGGSPDIPSSADRLEKYTQELQDQYDVQIVETIEQLCERVDGILLESVDGRPHLEQIKPVLEAGKPVFVDKPLAGSLSDVLEIYRLAKEYKVPCWSSSSLRYSPGIIGMRNHEKVGEVIGCDAFSPCSLESHHPDLYWYGIHGVEILFTIMGPGCQSVSRVHTEDTDLVVGVWEDGRIGTFRGLRKGHRDYGALVYGTKGIEPSGSYGGYAPLVEEIIKFFKTGQVPIPEEETIEIYAFMTAADESKALGGVPVSIAETIQKAQSRTFPDSSQGKCR